MSNHQVIYTSCKRGINGASDGQQIFSYDREFNEISLDEVRRLFMYTPPRLEKGAVMTDELAAEMPQAFIYRQINDGKCAIALNTYLGRDYMGPTGRFGNTLSHVILFDKTKDAIYPCEYYGGEMLREKMEFDEVNNPERPDFLPSPVLERGSYIDLYTVMDFVSADGRLDVLKNMLRALLVSKKNKKRILICDEQPNILKWIAAISYCLPVEIALNLKFSTYEFDPAVSSSIICGVVPQGTAYGTNFAQDCEQNYVFDFARNEFALPELDGEFYDYIDVGMTITHERLEEYFSFIIGKTRLRDADEAYEDGYYLYDLLTNGINTTSEEEFIKAMRFIEQYCEVELKDELAQLLIESFGTIPQLPYQYLMRILSFVCTNYSRLAAEQKNQTDSFIAERVLSALERQTTPELFENEYADYKQCASLCGGSLLRILCSDSFILRLLSVIERQDDWKAVIAAKIICAFMQSNLRVQGDMSASDDAQQLIQKMTLCAYSQTKEIGRRVSKEILEAFSSSWQWLVRAVLKIETAFATRFGNDSTEVNYIYDAFCSLVCKAHAENALQIGEQLSPERELWLYTALMRRMGDIASARNLFADYTRKYSQDKSRLADLVEPFAERLLASSDSNSASEQLRLLNYLLENKISVPCFQPLVTEVARSIPLKPTGDEALTHIANIMTHFQVSSLTARGRLAAIFVGTALQKNAQGASGRKWTDLLRAVVVGPIKINEADSKATEGFIEWICENLASSQLHSDAFARVVSLFDFDEADQKSFWLQYITRSLKLIKKDNYEKIVRILDNVLVCDSRIAVEIAGRSLSALGKKKLDLLDEFINTEKVFDKTDSKEWNSIYSIAVKTNPIIWGISKHFD